MTGIFAAIGKSNCKELVLNGLEAQGSRENEISAIAIKSEGVFSYMQYEAGPAELKKNAMLAEGDGNTAIAVCKNIMRRGDSAISADSACCIAAAGELLILDELKERFSKSNIHSACDMLLTIAKVVSSDSKAEMQRRAFSLLENSISYIYIPKGEEAVYCHRGEQPLWIGISETHMFLSGNASALGGIAEKCVYLKEGESAKLTAEKAYVFDSKLKRIKKNVLPAFESKALSEERELSSDSILFPVTVRETVKRFTNGGKLNFSLFNLSKRTIEKTERIIFTAPPSCFGAAMLGAYNLKMLCDIPSAFFEAGELRYSKEVFKKDTLLITLSDGYDDTDALACVKRAKSFGAKTLAVTPASASALAAESDIVINPDPDGKSLNNSVLSFLVLHLTLCFLSLHIGYKNEIVSELYLGVTIKLCEMLSGKTAVALKGDEETELLSRKLLNCDNIFVTGLDCDFALSHQGAKIIQDTARVNASPVSLFTLFNTEKSIIKNSVIIAFITSKELLNNAVIMLRRLEVLGADITVICDSNTAQELEGFGNVISFSDSIPLFNSDIAAASLYASALKAREIINEESEKQAIS
ncbi:MAG: SIS domain-containing protein [Eubacterium sp.]|nr:SIS domain-containing protein [Eubacterium sp.]